MSPYLHKPAVIIMMLFAISVNNVIRASCAAYGACSPRSYYGVILIMTSFTTELQSYRHTDTLPHLIYKA